MKICVYAISKNEERYIKRFCNSSKEADLILICDTGSTDNTIKLAKEYGAIVHNISVIPWRFDMARNIALGLIPEDIDVCVVLDLDEVLLSGWREEIEKVWQLGETNILQHLFKNLDREFPYEYTRIFSRFGWVWRGICHERAYNDIRIVPNKAITNKILIEHKPDELKHPNSYIDLIKANAEEYFYDLFPKYYYIIQLYVCDKYLECIQLSNKVIELCPPNIKKTDPEFNIYDLNLIYLIKANCLDLIGKYTESIENYKIACNMNLEIRQPLVALAQVYFERREYTLCYKYCMKAYEIKKRLNRIYEGSAYWKERDLLWTLAFISTQMKN